jgi:Tol biopolymer transport system component
MEIKFNCSNPTCNQRIAVDEALAGRELPCPACATILRVPPPGKSLAVESSPTPFLPPLEIKFNCNNPDCLQPIAVDPLQAGQRLKCPKCGNQLCVPGTRIESVADAVLVEALPVEAEIAVAVVEVIRDPLMDETVTRLWNLLKGWGLGAAILGLLIGIPALHSWVVLPRNLDAMLDEIYFHGEILIAPAINHAGTELVYVRTVEGGVGIFLVNLETLERKQIALAEAADASRGGAVKLFGWSPDDHYLAFSTLQKGKENRNISLCDGRTGAVLNTFESPHSVETGKWLAANSLAMIDNTHLLFLLNLEPDSSLGQYGNKGFVKLQQLDKAASELVPDSSRSVTSIAYVDKGNVWSFDLPDNKLTQLTHLTNATISSLDYSGDTDRYLFGGTIGKSSEQILYQYDLRMPKETALTRLAVENFSAKGQWIQDGAGIAYVGTEGNRYFLGVNAKDPASNTNLFTAPPQPRHGILNRQLFPEGAQVLRTYSINPKGNKLYAVASVNYEPLAIWEYDMANYTLRNVVPDKERLVFSRTIVPVQASIAINQSNIDYYYLPPAGMDPHKKYPAVFDVYSDLGYQPNSQLLANAGIFYFTANPYGAGHPDYPTRPKEALKFYDEILKNPNVDPHRVYLLGQSAGTGDISDLLDERPELWRGAIMLSPVRFPSLASVTRQYPSIFFSFGIDDNAYSRASMERFAQEACGHLIRTRITYGVSGHIFYKVDEDKKRYKEIATFILADY